MKTFTFVPTNETNWYIYFLKFTCPLIHTMNTNPKQQNARFPWTQASHDVYQTAVDGLGGPNATTGVSTSAECEERYSACAR